MRPIRFYDNNSNNLGSLNYEKVITAEVINTMNEASELNLDVVANIENKKLLESAKFIQVYDGTNNRLFRKDSFSLGSLMTLHGTDVGFDDFASEPIIESYNAGDLDGYLNAIIPSDYILKYNGFIDTEQAEAGNEALTWTTIGSSLDNLRYISDALEFDFDFSVVYLEDNQILQKVLNVYKRFGSVEPSNRYVYGINANEIVREENSLETYTAAVGLGYNTQQDIIDAKKENEEQVSMVDLNVEKPLTFKDVAWDTSLGNPVNKPFGQNYVELTEYTKNTVRFGGRPRIKIFEYPDEKNASTLLQNAYNDLLALVRPKTQFRVSADKFFNTSSNKRGLNYVYIGDSVSVIRHDLGIKYLTRVFRTTQNLVTGEYTAIEFGDVLFESKARTLKRVEKKVNSSNKKMDSAYKRINELENVIRDLNDRLNDSGEPVDHSDASYFTFAEVAGGLSITGLSTLGLQAIENGLLTDITTPELYESKPIISVVLARDSVIDIPDFTFRTTKNIKYIYLGEYRSSLNVKHLRIDEGLTRMGLLDGLTIKSNYLRIPDSIESFDSNRIIYKQRLNMRISVPYFFDEIPNATGWNAAYTYYRFPDVDKEDGDFSYTEIKSGDKILASINGLSDLGATKKNIVVPVKIGSYETTLSRKCFTIYGNLENVIFETDIEKLPDYTFQNTSNLKEVTFSSVEVIGEYAFDGCTLLTDVDFGDNIILNDIQAYAFRNTGLTVVYMPNSVQKVGAYAFNTCKNVSHVRLSEQLLTVEEYAFQGCGIENYVDIPRKVITIGKYAFHGNKIENVAIYADSALLSIGSNAFRSNLITEVTLPKLTIANNAAFDSGVIINRF